MRRQRAVMFLLVATLLAGACGGGGDDEDTGAGGTTVEPAPDVTSSTAPPTTDPALVARAQAAVFQQADFPAGWRALPQDDPGLGLDTVWRELTRCLGVEDTAAAGAAAATSPTFRQGQATQAQATVAFTDESSAGAISTALDGPKSEGCLQQVFAEDVKRNAPEGAVPGPVAVAPLEVPPAGTKTSAFRATFTIDLEGLTVSLFEDFLVVFDGDAVIRMAFLNPGSAFPPQLQRSLVEKVVSRA